MLRAKIPVVESFEIILQALPELLKGAIVTLKLTAIVMVVGMGAGSLIGIARLSSSSWVSLAARAYIDFFRGTPLLIQIFIVYFGIPALVQNFGTRFTFDREVAAIIALSLNSGAYLAEIVRAGIQSIETGQREASESLGLGPIQTMRYIIFPQALRRMIPPLGNEFISLLKDTSLVAIISLQELFQTGRVIVSANYRAFEIYTAVALIYLVLTLLSSQVFSWLERRMNPIEKAKRAIARPSRIVESP